MSTQSEQLENLPFWVDAGAFRLMKAQMGAAWGLQLGVGWGHCVSALCGSLNS